MHLIKLTTLILCLMATPFAFAQANDDEALTQIEALQLGLYPPQILIRMQDRLGIYGEQRGRISKLVGEFNTQVAELQWTMPTEQQKLKDLTSQNQVDAEAAIAQSEKILELESQFKLAHIELLVAIKNELNEEQIESLNQTIRQRLNQARNR